jgi:putative oxidoreductase
VAKAGFPGYRIKGAFCTIDTGCRLQRLFSTFPNGWPGRGLLLLRGVGVPLIYFAVAGVPGALGERLILAQDVVAGVGGMALLAGLWTPLTGIAVAMDEIWIASSQHDTQPAEVWIHILFAMMSAGLAMLGPGAWSIDAYFFGRRRFDIMDRTKDR